MGKFVMREDLECATGTKKMEQIIRTQAAVERQRIGYNMILCFSSQVLVSLILLLLFRTGMVGCRRIAECTRRLHTHHGAHCRCEFTSIRDLITRDNWGGMRQFGLSHPNHYFPMILYGIHYVGRPHKLHTSIDDGEQPHRLILIPAP